MAVKLANVNVFVAIVVSDPLVGIVVTKKIIWRSLDIMASTVGKSLPLHLRMPAMILWQESHVEALSSYRVVVLSVLCKRGAPNAV